MKNKNVSCQSNLDCITDENQLFYNLPDLIKPTVAADLLDISVKTIYDWRYQAKTRNIPDDLFIKINRLLYLRTKSLRRWIISQNPSLGMEV